MIDKEIVRLKVAGDFACFTRPDLKVERMSYPCMTPSAARGVLESILWKPEFQWFVRRIIVLNPIKFVSIKRNEIKTRQGTKGEPIDINDVKNIRVQRNSIVLKEVAYIIEASVSVDEKLIEKTKNTDKPITVKKYREMFLRRVERGQCWHQPYLGTREFAAEFSTPNENDLPLELTYPIGSMLYDMFYDNKGKATPVFFYNVAIMKGVIDCPEEMAKKMLLSHHGQPKQDDDFNRAVYEHYQKEETGL